MENIKFMSSVIWHLWSNRYIVQHVMTISTSLGCTCKPINGKKRYDDDDDNNTHVRKTNKMHTSLNFILNNK